MLTTVVEVMKTRSIAPRTGLEPTFVAVPASVLTITPSRLTDVTFPGHDSLIGRAQDSLVGDCGFELSSSETNDLYN